MIQDKAYPVFHENQVLTQDHLNNVVRYLELEDRESRIVAGSGIRCGLNVAYDSSTKSVRLSIGAGTTSKGYLIVNRIGRVFNYYQDFILPESSASSYLTDDAGNPLKLYELLESDKDPDDSDEKNENALKIEDFLNLKSSMAVILHMEIASADLATCKIDSCDNEGYEKQLHWRALLINKNDLDILLKKYLGTNNIETYFRSKYDVHEVRIPRPRFKCENTQSYARIHLNYLYICQMAVADFKTAFENSQAAYSRYIDIANLDNEKMKFKYGSLHRNLQDYADVANAKGIQYFYDHLKDVAMALNEFNDAAFAYHCDCSLNEERYPNYLMVGSFKKPAARDFIDDVYRHYFEPCCKDLAGTNQKKDLINLYERVNAIIENYHRNFIGKSGDLTQEERLFIAAESRLSGYLGDLALPYYYKKDSTNLRKRWNPHKFARGQSQDIPFYWESSTTDAASWRQDPNSTLRFRLDRHDCFHIEGHLGMTVAEFKAAFDGLKREFGLPVDLKVLEAKNLEANNTEPCEYEQPYTNLKELETLFDLEVEAIGCFLTKLFDYFKRFRVVKEYTENRANLERCKSKLKEIFAKLAASIRELGHPPTSDELKQIIKQRELVCPVSPNPEEPSYYYVVKERALTTVSPIPIPIFLEYPGNHVGDYVNVIFSDGHVSTLDAKESEFVKMVETYVTDTELRKRFRTVSVTKRRETAREEVMPRATAIEKPSEVVKMVSGMVGESNYNKTMEKLDELINTAANPLVEMEFLAVQAAYQAAYFESVSDEEKDTFKFKTIEVIERGQKLEFFVDYNNEMADRFIERERLVFAFNILAGLLVEIRNRIKTDDIESEPSIINQRIKSMKKTAKDIAELLERIDSGKLEEQNIDKCVILPLLVSIYSRCWASKYFRIKAKYRAARESIPDEMTFSQYVHKHPGIEHIGGVPKGGTFIVVYKTSREIFLRGFEEKHRPLASDVYSVDELTKYRKYTEDLGKINISFGEVENDEIVADFCLPYICCSDTSSVEYIVFAELKIDLPEAVCNHEDKFKITYSPIGSTLSGTNVELDPNDNSYYFNPKGLAEKTYTITISLSTKSATYPIRVVEHPGAGYSAHPALSPQLRDGKYVWTFTADEDKRSYVWYMRKISEDSEEFTEVTQEVLDGHYQIVGVARTYELTSELEEVLDFELVLKVINGPCYEISDPVRYRYSPELNWNITPPAFCNDLPQVNLMYEPDGASLTGIGRLEGRVSKRGDGYIINPSGLDQDTYQIEMSLEGYEPHPIDIYVLRSPDANFNWGQPVLQGDEYSLTLIAADIDYKDVYWFEWFVGDEVRPRVKDQKGTFEHQWNKYYGTDVNIRLRVTNGRKNVFCEKTNTQKIKYEAEKPEIIFPDALCSHEPRQLIDYLPPEAEIKTSSYVKQDISDKNYYFDPSNLPANLVEDKSIIEIKLDGNKNTHEVTVLRTPSAEFTPSEGEYDPVYDPGRNKDYIILTATETNPEYTYEWRVDDDVIGEGRQYRLEWNPQRGLGRTLKLVVTNKICSRESKERRFDFLPREVEKPVISSPVVLCNHIEREVITYSPDYATIKESRFVQYDIEKKEYYFYTTGLREGRHPIIINSGGDDVTHYVTILRTPSSEFTPSEREYKPVYDPDSKVDYIILTATETNREYTYEWTDEGGVISRGRQYRLEWDPKDGLDRTLKLRVANQRCSRESERQFKFPPREVRPPGDGPFVVDRGRFNRLRDDFVELGNDAAHGTIVEHDMFKASVESINRNNEILFRRVLEEPAPDVNPVDNAVMTNMIGENIKNLQAMIDNLAGSTLSSAEKRFARKYIKSNLLTVSELLIARSKDLGRSTKVLKQMTTILPKARSFFRVSDTTTPKRELVSRAAGKENIKDFLSLVEKI